MSITPILLIQHTVNDLHDLLLTHEDVQGFLDSLAELSVPVLAPAAVECGISYQDHGRTITLASTDPAVDVMDERQYDNGDGPCLTAIRTGTITIVQDVEADARWPGFLRPVADAGYQSMIGVPLGFKEPGNASINFYGKDSDLFTPERQAMAGAFAAMAAKASTMVRRLSAPADDRHMGAVLEARTPINTAVGIIMGQNQCLHDEAFEILRTSSNHQNTRISALAQHIVDRFPGTPEIHQHQAIEGGPGKRTAILIGVLDSLTSHDTAPASPARSESRFSVGTSM